MVYIYVLELVDNKYYIGKTNNPQFRLESHFNSNGSAWTKKYKPKNIIELIPNCDDYDEDKYTLKYMEKYGINNVRGGSFCEIKLNEQNIMVIKKMINSSTDKCYICGNNNHFAKDCKSFSVKKAKIPNINLNEKCDCATSYFSSHRRINCLLNKIITYFDDEDDIIDELVIDNNSSCTKTIIDNNLNNVNNTNNVNSKIFNCSYCNKEFDTLKGATCHENLYCKLKNQLQQKNKNDTCYRCGREGHFSNDCYATKHINGKYL
jgi:hypothetical protein